MVIYGVVDMDEMLPQSGVYLLELIWANDLLPSTI